MNDVKFNNFCRYWQFEHNTLPKIKRLVRIYLKSILDYDDMSNIVNISTTKLQIRTIDDNLENGLIIDIDWFEQLKPFEQSLLNKKTIWQRIFGVKNDIITRNNFQELYFYFEYMKSFEKTEVEKVIKYYCDNALMLINCRIKNIENNGDIYFYTESDFLTYLNSSYKLVNFNTMISFYNKCIELKENNK